MLLVRWCSPHGAILIPDPNNRFHKEARRVPLRAFRKELHRAISHRVVPINPKAAINSKAVIGLKAATNNREVINPKAAISHKVV